MVSAHSPAGAKTIHPRSCAYSHLAFDMWWQLVASQTVRDPWRSGYQVDCSTMHSFRMGGSDTTSCQGCQSSLALRSSHWLRVVCLSALVEHAAAPGGSETSTAQCEMSTPAGPHIPVSVPCLLPRLKTVIVFFGAALRMPRFSATSPGGGATQCRSIDPRRLTDRKVTDIRDSPSCGACSTQVCHLGACIIELLVAQWWQISTSSSPQLALDA